MLSVVRRLPASLVLAGMLLAAIATAEPAPTPGAAAAPADSIAPSVPVPETPLAREIREARGRFQAELARLTALYNAASTPETAREAQRAVAALKSRDEIEILAIQARHARAAGMTARADEIDALIAQLRADAPDGTPSAPTR